MCTAITYTTNEHYFGRNLDLEHSYNEKVTITPRNFPVSFRHKQTMFTHFAIIGMAYVNNNYPLYFDAINEKGLGIAGLNFPDLASYNNVSDKKDNIASFELILWILGQCKNISDVKNLLKTINITNEQFSDSLLATPLHWMVADKEKSIVIESLKKGLKVYDNPVGVMTNSPGFDFHLLNLNNYIGISSQSPRNRFADTVKLKEYSRGMGAIGLPGDLSSSSRFIRAAFTKLNSRSLPDEKDSINQFFHILGAVEQQNGCVCLNDGSYEITLYSSCCNLDKGIYYYTTYKNHQITAIDMFKTDLNSNVLSEYSLIQEEQINYIFPPAPPVSSKKQI